MNLSGTIATSPKFQETLEFLDALIYNGIKLGLENTTNFLACLDNPHREGRYIHVAGTNGKGSVCVYLANALTACGLKTGFYSSPHLVNLRERLRIDGEPIPEKDFVELSDEMRERAAPLFAGESPPTFFEFISVLAFLYFARQQCDIAVMETGMGGRLDSTNVLTPQLSIITSIGMDHVIPLGGTLTAIAGEKAGIIKPCAPVITDHQEPPVMAVLERVAAQQGVPLIAAGSEFEGVDFEFNADCLSQANRVRWRDSSCTLQARMLGQHQLRNISVAWAALQTLKDPLNLDLQRARNGIARARWPARLDFLPDGILLDAAHNAHAMDVLVRELQTMFPGRRWNLLFGCLKSKPWMEMLSLLVPLCNSITLAGFEHPDLQAPTETEAWLQARYPNLQVQVAASPIGGLQRIRNMGDGLVLGSLYLAGEILQEYYHGKPTPIQ